MKHTHDIDFALDRHQRQRTRQWLLAGAGLLLGLQVGVNVWRWQSAQDQWATWQAQQRLQARSSGQGGRLAALSPAQVKSAGSAQAMLDSLALPWDALLGAIESARTAPVVIDSIRPSASSAPLSTLSSTLPSATSSAASSADSGDCGMAVDLGISSPDFAGVAEFVRALRLQPGLHGVMLVSETLQDRGLGNRNSPGIRAGISACFIPPSRLSPSLFR